MLETVRTAGVNDILRTVAGFRRMTNAIADQHRGTKGTFILADMGPTFDVLNKILSSSCDVLQVGLFISV